MLDRHGRRPYAGRVLGRPREIDLSVMEAGAVFSLRNFHFLFILIAIIAADMFGAWAVWSHSQTRELPTLVIGILSFLFGFALVVYLIWLVRKLNRAKIK